jgi:HEPN domain-containing protein
VNKKVKYWLVKAFEDYKTIKILLKSPKEDLPTSAICFHSQQFIEKLLKAFLTFHNIPFPKTHILEILKQKCVEIDDSFQDIDFKNLSQYAVEIRYPDEFYLPDVEEAIESVKIAEQIKNIILEKIGLKEEDIMKLFDEIKEK